MAYRRVLTVQDISCIGQCSMTVALPILSACGHETCILPSAVLSTHTGGFGPVYFKDMTDALPGILDHWQEQEFTFDAVYTGYLGNAEDIKHVKRIFDTMLAPGGARVVDPAMADHGKLYSGFDMEYAHAMKELCTVADVILPNVTEACLLTDTPYQADLNKKFVAALLEKLERIAPNIVLTGIGYRQEETGVVVSQMGNRWHYVQKKIFQSFHGTGDVFASAFLGAWQQGKNMNEAARIAADYTAKCIEKTWKEPAHWYGIKFEASLQELMNAVFSEEM